MLREGRVQHHQKVVVAVRLRAAEAVAILVDLQHGVLAVGQIVRTQQRAVVLEALRLGEDAVALAAADRLLKLNWSRPASKARDRTTSV